jgi:hypothetical protein
MEINWQAPFQLAWELGLFLLGSVLILLVVIMAILVTYGLVKGFILAMKRARTPKAPEAPSPNLKAVKN